MGEGKLDFFQIILHADIVVQLVLLGLVICSIVSWAIILKKRATIKEVTKNNQKFLEIYTQSDNLRDIFMRVESLPFSPLKNMFLEGYYEMENIRSANGGNLVEHLKNFGLNGVERALQKGAIESNLRIESLLSILASIGSVAPFVGLFGTVWGIVNSFTGLAGGGGTLEAVAPGIAEALIATAIGLAAAIPAVWFYNHLSTENQRINSKMESFGQSFLNRVERSSKFL